MEFVIKKIVIVLIVVVFADCFAVEKSIISEIPQKDDKEIYNPFLTASLSLVPGGGQIYTKRFAKGFLFLASEGIIGWISLNYWKDYHESFDGIYSLRKQLNSENAIEIKNRSKLAEYDNLLIKVRYYNASALFGAVGIWNLIDAVGASNIVSGVENPSPRKAMALSAIPFSGAGQFYNGEWFKAGLVIATQTAFVFGGVQYQYLMKKSQDYAKNLAKDSSFQSIPREERFNSWQSRYREASKRRTMFFWYSIIFYIYGITDAYVDASLHKFENKFNISADFSPRENEVALGFTFRF